MNDELCSLLHNAFFDFFLENGEIQEFSEIMMLPPPFLPLFLPPYFFLSFQDKKNFLRNCPRCS